HTRFSRDWSSDVCSSDLGELLSEELVQACLQAVDARDAEVQAWQALDRDHVLEQARACDDTRRSGQMLGPLHGVPVALKDNIDNIGRASCRKRDDHTISE